MQMNTQICQKKIKKIDDASETGNRILDGAPPVFI